jgi:type III pantothenate kinase
MNKYYLLIDAGNSFCKIKLYNSETDQSLLSKQLKYIEIENYIKNELQIYTITFIFVCSVKTKIVTDRLDQICNRYLNCHIVLVNSNDYKIIPSEYNNFESLGADRWISILGLHLQGKINYCVIDCGTAITVDYVIDSKHIGGLIGPGLNTLSECLLSSTDLINKIDKNTNRTTVNYTATSTIEGISNASYIYFTGFINSILNENKIKYGENFLTYITGGDFRQYNNIENYNIKYLNNLVIDGLFHVKKLL